MSFVVDTSVLIDYLRGHLGAADALESARRGDRLIASEMTRVEVLAGMRGGEERLTRALLSALEWRILDEETSEVAGELGRRWLPSHHTIDGADLVIAATTIVASARLLTRNVKHFPMFDGLRPPY
ncbi:MAG: type II toxin-antitoxin system VapC family toxin [Ornithinimicrobium sp.]